jgi:hypothetical protein
MAENASFFAIDFDSIKNPIALLAKGHELSPEKRAIHRLLPVQ